MNLYTSQIRQRKHVIQYLQMEHGFVETSNEIRRQPQQHDSTAHTTKLIQPFLASLKLN